MIGSYISPDCDLLEFEAAEKHSKKSFSNALRLNYDITPVSQAVMLT